MPPVHTHPPEGRVPAAHQERSGEPGTFWLPTQRIMGMFEHELHENTPKTRFNQLIHFTWLPWKHSCPVTSPGTVGPAVSDRDSNRHPPDTSSPLFHNKTSGACTETLLRRDHQTLTSPPSSPPSSSSGFPCTCQPTCVCWRRELRARARRRTDYKRVAAGTRSWRTRRSRARAAARGARPSR